MEIKTTNTASFDSKTVNKLQDLLLKLEASTFKAIITNKISNQFFAIQTKAGTLQISTDLPVQVGDELTLNANSKKAIELENLQILKINRPISKNIQSITNTSIIKELAPTVLLTHQNVLKAIPQTQQHFIARVINHDKSTIHLESLKGESFSINKESFKNTLLNINKGEYLAIKWMPDKNIEVQQINKEQLLHQAQRQLLPKQQPLLQTHQRLSQAAFKLFESINNEAKQLVSHAKEKATPNNPIKLQETALKEQSLKLETSGVQPLKIKKDSLESLIKIIKDNTVSSNNKKSNINPDTLITLKKIKRDINNLLTSNRISFKFLAADTIHKLLNSLNALNQSTKSIDDKLSFPQKLSFINQSIDQLLKEIEIHSSKIKSSSKDEEAFLEALKTSLKEARQSFDSTLNKVLFQNTSSKLNQEINNSFLINTQIPVEIDKQTKDLNLKIKQHKKESEQQEDAWEIHLSLEMGSLGFISTKIMLTDYSDVSIQFWAELVKTKQLIESKKSIFQQQISKAGFTLKDINIFLGKKIEEVMPVNISNKQFIDINV